MPESHLPERGRISLFHGPEKPLELCDVELPNPGEGEALVRILCCTICGSDLHTYRGTRSGPVPTVLGHETIGEVVSIGSRELTDLEGRRLKPGDRITWSVAVSCGSCDRCRSGWPQKCRSLSKYGHAEAAGRNVLSGGLSEYFLLRENSAVIKVPEAIPLEVMSPVNCATSTVAACLRLAGECAGQRVLVFGAGMLGLTATAFAKTLDADSVTLCDPNRERLRLGGEFGADSLVALSGSQAEMAGSIREHSAQEDFDIVLELSGAPEAVELACELGAIGARIVLAGSVMGTRPVKLDPESIVRRCLTIRGIHNYTPVDLHRAVQFLKQHHRRWPFAGLVEKTFPLMDVNAAFDYAINERPVRVAVCP